MNGYASGMGRDLRDSLTIWGGAITFAAIFWVVLRFDPIRKIVGEMPAGLWVVVAVVGLANLGRVAWGLWSRRDRGAG